MNKKNYPEYPHMSCFDGGIQLHLSLLMHIAHKIYTAHRCSVARLLKFCKTRSGCSWVSTTQRFGQ